LINHAGKGWCFDGSAHMSGSLATENLALQKLTNEHSSQTVGQSVPSQIVTKWHLKQQCWIKSEINLACRNIKMTSKEIIVI